MNFRHLVLTLTSSPMQLTEATGWQSGDLRQIHWAILWPKSSNTEDMCLGSDNTIVNDGSLANPISAGSPYSLIFPADRPAQASDLWIAGKVGETMFVDVLVRNSRRFET